MTESLNRRWLFSAALVFLVCAAVLPDPAAAASSPRPCHEHPQLIGKCFSIRGRMRAYNGAPIFRIWPVGSRRLLLVSESRFLREGFTNMPAGLGEQVNWQTDVFANFVVCPFTEHEPDVAQIVCIDSAEKITTRDHPG